MSEPGAAAPKPRRFARAEQGARSGVVLLGAGVMAYTLGGLMQSGLAVRVAERVGLVTEPTLAFAVGWALQRVWLFVALPAVGWVVGRLLTRLGSFDFAVTAAVTGEVFGMLLEAARNGFDVLFLGWLDAVARLATFLVGLWLVWRATLAGRRAAAEAQAQADALARAQRAQYEALARPPGPVETPTTSKGD